MTDKATPEPLKHATGLEQFAELLPAYGFDPKSLKDASAAIRRQHARIAELEAQIEAVVAGGVQALSAAPGVDARITAIEQAIRDYHFALDNRKHGGIATFAAFTAILQAMDMQWTQGAEVARRSQAAQRGGA